MVPSDWDIIRFDCFGKPNNSSSTIRYINKHVFQTKSPTTKEEHSPSFYGGAYASLWKESSIQKLKSLWLPKTDYFLSTLSEDKKNENKNNKNIEVGMNFTKANDIDCELQTEKLVAYCVRAKFVKFHAFGTSIPKT
jgi:hypothetical protein